MNSANEVVLHGKTALVTGGARGIGQFCARALLRAGARVVISTRHAEHGRRARDELRSLGDCDLVVTDLAAPSGITDLVEGFRQSSRELHVLVNNAGVTWGAPIESYPAEAWSKVLQLDVAAPFLCVQALLPELEAAAQPGDPARVINLGSIDGHAVGGFDNYAYAAAKAGIHHLTRVLAYRLGPRGIAVNCLAPGPVRTKMTAGLLEETQIALIGRTPLRRLCTEADIAGALTFLAGPASTFVTGAVLPIDGGLAASPWWPDEATNVAQE